MEATVDECEYVFLVSIYSSCACSGLSEFIWTESAVDETTAVCAELHAVM